MYAGMGLLFPCFQDIQPEEFQQFEELHKPDNCTSLSNLTQFSTISEYDLGGEWDLFRAAQPIMEEPIAPVYPSTAAISVISHGSDVISAPGHNVGDSKSLQGVPLLSDVSYECRKELLANRAIGTPLSEIVNVGFPLTTIDEDQSHENEASPDVQFHKCVSSGCLSSMEWMHGSPVKPSFMDFPEEDFGAVCGMRRAFSEGDIKSLDVGNVMCPPLQQPTVIGNCTPEERREKLLRYRNKKTKRNYGRKIKKGSCRQPTKNPWKICQDRSRTSHF